jgi:hypothetical protein
LARPLTGLCSGLRMLGRSPLFLKLTACVMLTGIVMEGMYELLAQYFQLKLGYTAADQVRWRCNARKSISCIVSEVQQMTAKQMLAQAG